MFRLVGSCLVIFSALSVGASSSGSIWSPNWTLHTWNEYLDAEGIIPAELDALPITRSPNSNGLEYESLQGHLEDLLNKPGVLSRVYANYLDLFNKTGDFQRAQIFKANLLDVARHNAATAQGKMSWTKGVNDFTDMTFEEFKERFIGSTDNSKLPLSNGTVVSNPFVNTPSSIDWREKGCVTKGKCQGNCNSCFIFAALAIVESRHCQKSGTLEDLSPQHVMDCCEPKEDSCWPKGIAGQCKTAGSPFGVLKFALGGVARESDYPYEAKDGECRAAGKELIHTSYSYTHYWQGGPPNEPLLGELVAQNPVSVSLDPSRGMAAYRRGMYDRDIFTGDCDNVNGDGHSVAVVGYTPEYWILKNSWGTWWGMDGFMYLKRGENKCGVARVIRYLKD